MTDVERRIVTVLFADLVGFTSLSERLDAEDVATVQDAYFATVRDTVARHGGQLEKFIGDAAMAVYGVPRGRDDDAERAVRTGLALVEAVERLGARLDLDGGDLRLRVGVNTGEVVHAVDGPDAGRVTGDTVNTAARLQTAADPETVLLGEATAFAVAEAIEVEAVPPLTLKGKAAPVRAWRVAGVRPQRSRELAMGSLRAPTIGRTAELGELQAALRRAVDAGVTARWLVLAPPGVGKTRLVEAFAAHAASLAPLPRYGASACGPRRSGRSTRYGRSSRRRCVTQASRPTCQTPMPRCAGGSWRPAMATLARRSWQVSCSGSQVPTRPAGPAPGGSPNGQPCSPHGWTGSTRWPRVGPRRGWWRTSTGPGSTSSRSWRRRSPPRGRGRLIVATARPSFIQAAPAWAIDDPATARRVLELPTLPALDAATLVRELVGDALPDDLVTRIVERSDGNCLFIEELLRTWVGTGVLVSAAPPLSDTAGSPTAWRLAVAAGDVNLPDTVHAIYAAQLDDLPPPARLAARRGAVAGRRFPLGALDALGVAGPVEAVEELKRRALVSGPFGERLLGDSFAYRHALLRDAGYASLARAERAVLHVRLARWLEAASGSDRDLLAATVGEHLATALASAPVLAAQVAPGFTRDECAEEAAAWLERAADRALADGAGAAAADLYRRSAGITRQDRPADRSRRLTSLGRALAPIGGTEEAIQAFREAIEAARAARAAGDGAWRAGFAQASEALASLLYEQLRFVEAWHLGDAALIEMGGGDDLDAARVRLAGARGQSGETNDTGPWVDAAERAVAAARAAGDAEAEWAFERDLIRARSEAGLTTLEDWLALGERARARGDAAVEVSARTTEAGWRMATAPREVPALLAPARELAMARGLIERLGWVEHTEAEAALGSGDWAVAIEAGLRAVALGDRHGYDRIAVRSWAALLPAASLRGERAVLEQARAWFAARAGHLPDSPYGRGLYAGAERFLGLAAVGPLHLPDLERIRPAFAQWRGNGSYEWMAAGDAILDAWFGAGRLGWVGEALDEIMAGVVDDPFRPAVLDGEQHRARLELRGTDAATRSEATAVVRAGLAELRAIGLPLWIARGLRVLEEAGEATAGEIGERASLEAALGVVRPTL